ncbi:MAG: histidine kinase [Clostridia bacterium]|nr:histidine kinase [Clostridia bacterium]
MFIILCISCVAISMTMMNISKNEMLMYNESNAKNMIETTEGIIDEIKQITLNIAVDTDVRNYIMSESPAEMLPGYQSRIYSKLYAYKSMTKYVYSIYLYNEKNDTVISHKSEGKLSSFPDNDWIDIYRKNPNDTMCIAPWKVMGNYPYLITYISSIAGKGCVVVTADIYMIAKNSSSAYDGKYKLYITDKDNSIIYSNDESKFMTVFDDELYALIKENEIFKYNGDSYYCYFYETKDKRYIVTAVINDYIKHTHRTKNLLIAGIILIFIFGILISGMLAFNSFEPISKIIKVIDKPHENDFIEEMKNNEVKYITTQIINYIDSNEMLKEELNNRLAEHNQLSMMAMQMQINPHFLNNTLNIIGLKLAKEIGAENDLTVMVTMITRLIQYILNVDTIQVDFKQELDFLKNYIALLNYRYKDLNVIWNIDEKVYRCKIVRVCLQPIVENAVYHGLASKDGEKILKISAKVEEENVVISIEDNGVGISEDKIEEINKNLDDDTISSKHIGIKNVYKRLRIVYNEKADLKIESKKGEYTRICIIIPTVF